MCAVVISSTLLAQNQTNFEWDRAATENAQGHNFLADIKVFTDNYGNLMYIECEGTTYTKRDLTDEGAGDSLIQTKYSFKHGLHRYYFSF